jgi:hypothetical protein
MNSARPGGRDARTREAGAARAGPGPSAGAPDVTAALYGRREPPPARPGYAAGASLR